MTKALVSMSARSFGSTVVSPAKLGVSTAAVEPRRQAWTSTSRSQKPVATLSGDQRDAVVNIATSCAVDLDTDTGAGVGALEDCLPGWVLGDCGGTWSAHNCAPKASSAMCIEYCNSRYIKCNGTPLSRGRRAESGMLEPGVAAEMGGLWEKVCAGKRSLRAKISKHPPCFR